MNIPILIHRQYDEDYNLTPAFGQYHDGSLAIQLIDQVEGPFATITVWVPASTELPADEFFVKNYSENEEIVAALLLAGWLTVTGRSVRSGFVTVPSMKMAGPLLEFYNKITGTKA